MFLPHAASLARILIPPDALAEPGAAHDVGVAVAIHIHRQVAEIVDVIVGVVDFAEAMRGPTRSLIPILAGDDVELAVSVYVNRGGSLAGARIDHVTLEQDL